MEDASQECNLLSVAIDGISDDSSIYFAAFYTCIAFSTLTFVVSSITGNYSQVDKLWSITPFIYAWIAVVDQRTLIMAVVATIWGIRLTYNFHRRGGYHWPPWKGEEDYRWAYIQQGHFVPILKEPIPWILFNFGFISFYQNFLLLLTAAPAFVASTMATNAFCGDHVAPFNIFGLDGIAVVLMIAFIIMESVADNQQYAFQTEKYRQINAGEERTGEYADGFCQSGLFAIVRKPNYCAEQFIWISFYIFSVAATGTGKGFINWSAIGFILLVILFQGSGPFTEKLTLQKYPVKYAEYQTKVGLYIPRLSTLTSMFRPATASDGEKKSLLQ